MTTIDTTEAAPYFASLALAADLAEMLDKKAQHNGKGATKPEIALRDELATALWLADLDTISSGGYTFTIEPEAVQIQSDTGSLEGEMVGKLVVHRPKKLAKPAAKKAPVTALRPALRPVTSLRFAMVAALNDTAPSSQVRQARAM